MTCITKGNIRCTRCCEAIHIPKGAWDKIRKQPEDHPYPNKGILKYWVPISKRRAKKINPYIFSKGIDEQTKRFVNSEVDYFTCKAMVPGVGCSIRNEEDHPDICKRFKGDPSYSPTCEQDINIIARAS